MSKIRIGIFGGTFNPPHIGHIKAAEAFQRTVMPDRLLIMPDFLPPHKDSSEVASAEDRKQMCNLAFSHIKNSEISDYEIKKGGKSYTSVTLKSFYEDGRELYFLCGTDMFLTLESWFDFETIFKLAVICCVRRENDPLNDTKLEQAKKEYTEKYAAKIIDIPISVTEVSSTEIREEIRKTSECKMLPESIIEYINEKGLYR